MPDERDIEKALRARAKRRREESGAPIELHPATRRVLLAEVARLKGGRSRGPVARWLWGSPLRLVLNLSGVAVLVIVAVLLLPQPHPPRAAISAGRAVLAENNREEIETPSGGVTTVQAQTDKDLRDASKFKSNTTAITLGDTVTVARKEIAPPPPTTYPAPRLHPPVPDQEQMPNNALSTEATAQTAASAAAPAVAIGATAAGADMPGAAPAPAPEPATQTFAWANSTTNFPNRDYLTAKVPGPMPLLGSFRTEQTGNRLRVIDADGSVYTGEIEAPAPQVANGTFPVQSRAFRVSGASVTRHQPVVFVGHLVMSGEVPDRGQASVAGGSVAAGGNGGFGGGGFTSAGTHRARAQTNVTATNADQITAGTALSTLQTAPQSSVQGTVYVGTNELQIHALPAGP